MSYKKDAASTHKSKMKGYAEGGAVEEGSGLLDQVEQGIKRKLSKQMGIEDEEPVEGEPLPEENTDALRPE